MRVPLVGRVQFEMIFKKKKEATGFTLIEVVMVLVLIGILAAVAVPKYFDFMREAELRAARATLAEAQARIEGTFSDKVLQGESCAKAVEAVNHVKLVADSVESDGARLGDWILTQAADKITVEGTAVSMKSVKSDNDYEAVGSLFVPACADDAGDSSGDSSGLPDGFPASGTWGENLESSCPYGEYTGYVCSSGAVIKSGEDYYFVPNWAQFSSAEAAGSFADSQAYASGAVMKLDFSSQSERSEDGKWSPALAPGTVYKASDGSYYAFAGGQATEWEALPPDGNWRKLTSP